MADVFARIERCENLGRMLEETARRHPRRKAVFINGKTVRYDRLNRQSNRYAHALRDRLKVRKSDRVAILLKNSLEFIYAFFGALKAGATVVPLNTFLAHPELKYILSDADVRVLISSDEFAPAIREFSEELPSLESLVTIGREDLGGNTWLHEEIIKDMPEGDPWEAVSGDDLAAVIYTSGTTGKPKGAMLTHSNLLSNVASSGMSINISKRDRILLILPMFHSFTLTACILLPISVGGGIIVAGKLKALSQMLKDIVTKRATIFVGIPHIYDMMADKGTPFWLRPILRLRLCISGSAPLSASTLRNFENKFRLPLLEGYGLSEASPVVSINPLKGERKPGSVGRPIPGVSVRILSMEGVELPPGSIGEIAVKGPNVMKGYLNRSRETRETMNGEWLLTGDLGKIDEDGYIYIVDRKKDMILFHGMNIYPREIEEVLCNHPAVAEAAVIGKPDKRRGEVPVAVVSINNGEKIYPSELIRFCKRSLAGYKVPHKVIILDKLPRTPTGKILKKELKNVTP